MKAINLGFSHGSADEQNRFQPKEEEKYNRTLGSSEYIYYQCLKQNWFCQGTITLTKSQYHEAW